MAFSRKLGDSELSYFLPSRADGVNDMYLHLGFRAPQSLVNPHRVAVAWAILRVRHPLLAANVVMEPGEYDSARFVYTPPTSPASALLAAQSTLLLRGVPKDSLINAYLNGPRTLSNDRVSVLMLSSPQPGFSQENEMGVVTPPQTPRHTTAEFDLTSIQVDDSDKICEFDLLFCAAHFLGDGIALHTCVNDLFTLLAGPVLFAPADSHLQPGGDSQISGAKSTAISGLNISGAASLSLSPGSGHSACANPETFAFGKSTYSSDNALNTLLEVEWSNRCGSYTSASPFSHSPSFPNVECISPLPPPLESRLPGPSLSASKSLPPSPLSTFQRVAHDLAFRRSQNRLIGGHSFTRVRASSPHFESDSSDTNQEKNSLSTSAGPLVPQSTKIPRRQCHTLVRTIAFPPELTQRVLKRCKEEGVSVAHVLFALCNVAWGRVGGRGNGSRWEIPMMMYSALNLRPYLMPAPAPSLSLHPRDASYWFLAVGYFNVVLPAFLLPQDDDDASDTFARKTLFHRARISKRQCASAAKTPFLAPYAQRMARERGDRARKFARTDDGLNNLGKGTSGGRTAGLSKLKDCPTPEPAQMFLSPPRTPVGMRAPTPPSTKRQIDTQSLPERLSDSLQKILPSNKETSSGPLPETFPSKATAPPTTTPSLKPPSAALLGLSLLGNLDTMYSHSTYSPITLHTLTTGSRQRAGALLLFGYTFAGRLWVSLGWDRGAFGGEGGGQEQGEGKHCDRRDIVWEGLERERTSDGQIRERVGDGCVSGMGLVGCEGELGRWWREVVKGVGEFFGED